jgi:hypothetical protein
MIYLFAGDDAKSKLSSYEKFVKTLGGAETFLVNKNDFDPIQIESFFSSANLFFDKCIIIFSNIFEDESASNFLLEKLKNMVDSGNIFIFLEGALNKPTVDLFKKSEANISIFDLSKDKKEKYDNFKLAYDFEKRDKLNLWIHFRQAIDLGVGMEELVGVLFWKAKDMILKKSFTKFKEKELKDFVAKLSYLLPEARKNDKDAEASFEEFLLEAF